MGESFVCRMEETEKNGKIRGIKKAGVIYQGFYFANDNQKKPAQPKTHVHIP